MNMLPRDITKQLDHSGAPLWRKDSAVLFGRIEAPGDSDLFRSEDTSKTKAKRWDSLFSEEALGRKPSSIKAAARAIGQSGIISLGAGAPSSENFPFEKISVRVSNPSGFTNGTEVSESTIHMAKYDFQPDISDYSLDVALNYGRGTGSAQMLRFFTEHTELIHNPPYADWGCCLTVGSTSAWDSALRMFCERGDYIIMEKYTYSSALETARTLGVKCLSIDMDNQGILPQNLNDALLKWDESKKCARRPFLLYMVPTGQNPTGATQSPQRRKDIYALAQKFNLYIVEDEPYYYLQMQPVNAEDPSGDGYPVNHLIPSYLSLDVDGRVLRLDSVSKILSPGARLGWVTASQQVIEKFIRQNETSSQHPSGFSQVIVYKLLNHHWSHTGFLKWLEHIQSEYTRRRNTLVQACDEFLPKAIASWSPPRAGMFQWIEIDWKRHPAYESGSGHQTIQQTILTSAMEQNVFLTPGTCFWSDETAIQDRMFFRATYASAPLEDLREAVRRFGLALNGQFQ